MNNIVSTREGTRVITGKVRLNFPKLFKPEQINGEGDPKYSVMVLIPKTDTETIKNLREAEALAVENSKAKFEGKPVTADSVIKDADADGSAEDYSEREGCLYLSVSAAQDRRPQVVDAGVQEILDQSQVYSGVYARVSLGAFGYTYGKSKRGISFGLNNVQILGGGESLAGGKPASADFGAVAAEGVPEGDAALL